MSKGILLILFISGNGLSESLKPSLFSVDGIGFEAGAGLCVWYPLIPSFEASVLRIRSELSLELNRILWVQFTHRWLPDYSGELRWGRSSYNHSFHLGVCLILGAKDNRRFKEVKGKED